MLLSAQSPTPTEIVAFVACAGIIVAAATAYVLTRWVYHVRGLQQAVASSFAPVDVQVMRCVDLLRQFLQHPNHDGVGQADVSDRLRQAHRRLRDASRRAAARPENAQAIEDLRHAIVELRESFLPVLAELAAQHNPAVSREIQSEFSSAWQRLLSVQGPFRQAVVQFNEAISHPIGRVAAMVLRLERAAPLADLENND